MAVLENITAAALTVVALALTIIAFRAWVHARSPKVLLLALGFLFFVVKGLVVSVGLFVSAEWELEWFMPVLVIDLITLGVFYAAVLKQSPA